MRMTGSRACTRPTPVPKMPTGLVELMESMTKEVLSCNPSNVYEFCAAHMQKLLGIRDGPTGKRSLTLDQKISRARQIINQRAQKRWQIYDKETQLLCITDNKVEEMSLQTIMDKPSVTHELNLVKVEEIEISHCENNKGIEENGDVVTINKKISGSRDSNLNENVAGLEKKNIYLDNEISEPVEDFHVDIVTELSGAAKDNQSSKIKENEVIKNPAVPYTFEKDTKNMVVKETVIKSNDLPATALEELKISSDDQIHRQDLQKYSLNDIDVNVGDTIENQNENDNIPVVKEVHLISNTTAKNSMNNELLSEEINTTGKNEAEDDTIDIKEHSLEITKPSKIYENHLQISGVTPAGNEGVVALDINSGEIQDGEVQNTDKISNVVGNVISTLNVVSTINQAVTDLHSSGKGTITDTEQDKKTSRELDLCETSNVFFESSANSVSSDNRVANHMDLETAAITIQKVFRSFLFKSRASNDETSSMDEDIKEANGYSSANLSNDRRPLNITRKDTMLQTVNEEKSLSLSTDDSSTLSSAATIIQAHIRGFLVRNKLNSNKTASTNSMLNSEDMVTPSMESETNQNNKTVLNIHIVPDNIIPSLSRDESIVTSMDLSLDGSPPSSINLHPLGYDKSERRKQLKREDAIQSISPPSNNSGKLSEDVDSAKEILSNGVVSNVNFTSDNDHSDKITTVPDEPLRDIPKECLTKYSKDNSFADSKSNIKSKRNSLTKMSSDEMDVVTPYMPDENVRVPEVSDTAKLIHSGELHDVVLPTNVSRGSTSVVRGE